LDLDSQGNLSQYLTDDLDIVRRTDGGATNLFDGSPLQPMATTHPQIDLLHGHSALDSVDHDEAAEERAYSPELRALLRGLDYDYVIIDTPPAVGLRHLSPLVWADLAVIPLEPSMTHIAGFQSVLQTMEGPVRGLNPELRWIGLVNRANLRLKAQREKDAWLRATYGAKIFATLTSRGAVAEAIEESPAQPVWHHRGAPKDLREQWLNVCRRIIAK
jgi:chromosome partitioning protein